MFGLMAQLLGEPGESFIEPFAGEGVAGADVPRFIQDAVQAKGSGHLNKQKTIHMLPSSSVHLTQNSPKYLE